MFIKKIIRILQKKRCLICGAHDFEDFCQSCQPFLPILPHVCEQCAQILSTSDPICQNCQIEKPPFTATYSLFPYEFPIVEFIRRLKFQGQLIYAAMFGAMMIKSIQESWYRGKSLPLLIVPIPLHAKRLKIRGFNQALEIARPISKFFKIPLLSTQILRTKATLAQSLLTADERKINMSGAFVSTINLQGKHIAVVDDVITTGQTVRSFCQELQRLGAGQIDIWCCARALSIHTEVAQSLKTR